MELEYDSTVTSHNRLLPEELKWAIIFYKKQDKSSAEVADIVGEAYGRPTLSRQTVDKVWNKYGQNHSVANQWSRQGRPSVLTVDDLDEIKEYLEKNPKKSINEVKVDMCIEAGRSTINKHLLDYGLKSYRAPKKIYISPRNTGNRLRFAREMESKTFNYWKKVIFSDESSFSLTNPDGRIFVRRSAGNEYEEENIQFKSQSQTLMVWGAISIKGAGSLVRVDQIEDGEITLNGDRYLELLRRYLVRNYPDLKERKFIFQQYNAPSHRYHKVDEWFESKNILKISWPAQSPDLNIIESVWNQIFSQIKGETFTSGELLWKRIQKEWYSISKEFIISLYESLERRIIAVIDSEGKQTKY